MKMKLSFYCQDRKENLELHKINIFYGYASSGKTTFAESLESGLLGKDKSFTLNHLSITKEEKNVVYINSKESILDHIKMSSKSYLRKYYYDKIKRYLDDHNNILDNINKNFEELNKYLDNMSNDFNNKTSLAKINILLKIENNEELINSFEKVMLNSDSISSSAAKELLLMLITILNNSEKETHLIIDDFDSFLDEQTTIRLLKQLESFNGYVYLFTSKPNSIIYAIGKYGIFNIRENNFFDFSNVLHMIKKTFENEYAIENQTYEEYMLNYGYFENSGQLNIIYNQIKNNSIYSLGRMLTSKQYKITNTIDYDNISIIPFSDNEEKFLIYINNLINNN